MRWELDRILGECPQPGSNSLALRRSALRIDRQGTGPAVVVGVLSRADRNCGPVWADENGKTNRRGNPPNGETEVERAEKREFVTSLHDAFSDAGAVVVAGYTGLTVAEISAFRAKVKAAGGTVKVAKNRLAKIALQGTKSEGIGKLFKGQTLVVYSKDPIAGPKATVDYAKANEKLVIIGGAMGATNLDENGIKALATMPSLDELRAKLLGMIQTPASRIAQVVNAPAGQLARVFGAYARKDEAA
jgi:large subunit ribosomal protein L10